MEEIKIGDTVFVRGKYLVVDKLGTKKGKVKIGLSDGSYCYPDECKKVNTCEHCGIESGQMHDTMCVYGGRLTLY